MNHSHSINNAYLQVTRGLLNHPTEDRIEDGKHLVHQCIEGITNLNDFPPKILILLATVGFQPFEKLIKGIRIELDSMGLHIPLVGCSVAGFMTEKDINLINGSTLICIASEQIDVNVGLGEDVLNNRRESIDDLLNQLGIGSTPEEALNPYGDRYLMCFLPGFIDGQKYEAVNIHKAIRTAIYSRIPMVGAVAADHFERKTGWVFVNNRVVTNGAVMALIKTNISFGIGIAHGLHPTGEYLHIKEVSKDCRRIISFSKIIERGKEAKLLRKTPEEILKEYKKKDHTVFFGLRGPEEDEHIILYPIIEEDGSAFVNQPVHEHYTVELLATEVKETQQAASQAMKRAILKGHIDVFHLGYLLSFSCQARYESIEKEGLKIIDAWVKIKKENPGLPFTVAFVAGEIGLVESGRSSVRNWTVSELLLSDQLSQRSILRSGYLSIAKAGQRMAESESINEVLYEASNAITSSGFHGGMISLVFRDKGEYVIVPKESVGLGWHKAQLIRQKKAGECDVLTKIFESKESIFISDSRKEECFDPNLVKTSGVISQYIIPLKGRNGEVLGIMQIDLGDMSNLSKLPKYLETLFYAFANQIASAICRAFRIEELAVSDLFDKAVEASLMKKKKKAAIQEFVNVLNKDKDLLGTDIIHIRLISEDLKQLELVAGSGDYFRIALEERPYIPVHYDIKTSDSHTVKTYVSGESMWINNVEDDKESKDFVQYLFPSKSSQILSEWHSYANLLIMGKKKGEPPIGVITIASTSAWFFSESRWLSMKTLGQRLYFAIQHAEEIENREKRTNEVKFLLGMTPRLSTEFDLKKSLSKNAERIANAASADVVSFFLWDSDKNALVLQGQYNWKKDMIGKASYKLNEGVTGYTANQNKPCYISNLDEWKRVNRPNQKGKYENEMFGEKFEDAKYEIISIPLRFGKLLGVLIMQNIITDLNVKTKFITTDQELLIEVGDDLSAFIYASNSFEEQIQTLIEQKRSQLKMAYIGTILGQIIHDLRNKLESIRADITTMIEEFENNKNKKYVLRIKSVCEELTHRMIRYLDSIEREEFVKWTRIELYNVINNAKKRCDEKARQKGVNINFIKNYKVYVNGSALELEDAFFNIIDNAIKAMEKKGIIDIILEICDEGKKICIKIVDKGKGISSKYIPQVTKGFFKSTVVGRPAMGIFLSKSVFELHGGTLNIESQINKGTIVIIKLPICEIVYK